MLLPCLPNRCVPIVYPNKPWTEGNELVVQPKCDIPFGVEMIPATKLRLDILFDSGVNLVKVCVLYGVDTRMSYTDHIIKVHCISTKIVQYTIGIKDMKMNLHKVYTLPLYPRCSSKNV